MAPVFDLCDAALAAETDLDESTRAACRVRYGEIVDRLQSTWVEPASPREAARRLLAFLHDEALGGGYRPEASRLSIALRRGDYNCLSATLLYAALAERLGWKVEGLLWPAHVACALGVAEPIDVEPTCRDWFRAPDPLAQGELRRQALARLGVSFAAAAPRRLDRRQLVALVYFNLGTERLGAGPSSAARETLERAAALDPDSPEIRGNLLAALNNEAASLQREGAAVEARALLERCRRIAPTDPITAENLARLGAP